jgi:uncharacterized protein YjbI with pentapeptide repeats
MLLVHARCYATLRYATLRYATLRYATLRYATLHYAMLRYVTLRYVALCYVPSRLDSNNRHATMHSYDATTKRTAREKHNIT